MTTTVTRIEIAENVREAFTDHGAERTDLLEVAISNRARPEVVDVIKQLPERRYRALNDLWEHIGHLPVGV